MLGKFAVRFISIESEASENRAPRRIFALKESRKIA
jgi:hypothetical protein